VRPWFSRAIIATLLLIVAARPILLDRCIEACASGHAAASPACHHTSDAHARIAPPAQPCRHDHSAVMVGANTAALHDPSAVAMIPAAAPASGIAARAGQLVADSSPQDPPITLQDRRTPLRI
jgi:hypothetical protein